jgi:hypothetical protein
VQLLVAVAAATMFLVRRRAWSARSAGTDRIALDPDAASAPTVPPMPEDPGRDLAPSALRAYARRSRPTPARDGGALTVMRYLFLAFTGALVSFVIVIASLPDTSKGSPVPWLLALAGLAILCVVAPTVAEKPLDDTSAATLFASYQTRFFLRIAFGESIALFAFTFAFLGAPPWIFYVGCAIALVRLWTNAAPTRAALARDQATLDARDSRLSLVAALRAGSTLRD